MDDPTLAALVRDVAKRELGEDDGTREQALGLFRDWVVKNPDIRNCRTDDIFLLAFLRSRKFSVHGAQQLLLRFLKACQNLPKMMTNLDITEPKIEVLSLAGCLYVSPFRDEQGRSVTMNCMGAIKPTEHCYYDYGRFLLATLFSIMNDPVSQVTGFVHIYDLANMGAAHATFWPPLELVGFMKFFEQATPFRHKEVHIINLNPVIKVLFNMILYALSKKMQDRILIHDTLEDLHKKVSPKLLPKEYGGEISVKVMTELWKQKMLESRELVLGMSSMRLEQDNGGEAVETGSFRKLAID